MIPQAKRNQGSRLKTPRPSRLELIDSPSRTTGIASRGEPSLLHTNTQREYRDLIQSKIDTYVREHGIGSRGEIPPVAKEKGANLLILFRKLREGIVASSRRDAFAIEVYESSACWSVILRDSAQSTAILAQLTQLYSKLSEGAGDAPNGSDNHRPIMAFLNLLHLLQIRYPSQADFHSARSITKSYLPPDWQDYIASLAKELRRNNYTAFHRLTDPEDNVVLGQLTRQLHPNEPVYGTAVLTLIDQLRAAAREDAWKAIRSAYRELSTNSEGGRWLGRTLMIDHLEHSPATGGKKPSDLSAWISQKGQSGDVIAKENAEGRWLVSKRTTT